MYTRKIKLLLMPVLASLMAGCQISDQNSGQGALSLDVEMGEQTKAAMSSSELLSNALVNIYYADFSGLVRSYKYSDAPQTIWLPASDYRVDVIAGEASKKTPAAASWEQKSYKGSSPFTIVSGKSTTVQVVAGVSNVISKVTFDATVSENFKTGFSVSMDLGGNKLVYDLSKSGAEGYFLIDGMDDPQLDWTFEGVLAKDGSRFVKTGSITGLEKGTVYAMTVKYTVKDGVGTFELSVDYSTENIEDAIIFEPLSTGLALSEEYEIWACHATVHADVDESEYADPSKISFAYMTAGGSWLSVPAVRKSEGVYQAELKNLAPASEYSYKLVIDGEAIGDAMTFTTEAAPKVPNGSFEETSTSSSGKFKEFFNPSSADVACRTPWWGSGNGSDGIKGSADMAGAEICLPDTGTYYTGDGGKQSACLVSRSAVGMLAAGNLFSGYFAGLVGTEGGKVAFGRPFTGRPTALRLYMKYTSGRINHGSKYPDGTSIGSGDYDTGRIQIALGTWDYRKYGGTKECPILVNTTDQSTFVDFSNDASTLAYGDLQVTGDSAGSKNVWTEYSIPLEYFNEFVTPEYIVISCAASKYGDYFIGSDSSKMWIDHMELIYE